ncbi:MAG: flagellar hook-basal body complex protein FliE [Aeromonas sobria]
MIKPINSSQQEMLARMGEMQLRASMSPTPNLAPATQPDSSTAFGAIFKGVIDSVDAKQQHAAELARQIETGASDDLVGSMLASQKANLSFSALTQVRNKLTNAYDEVIKMSL